jgi:hypothetical protein
MKWILKLNEQMFRSLHCAHNVIRQGKSIDMEAPTIPDLSKPTTHAKSWFRYNQPAPLKQVLTSVLEISWIHP